MHRRKFASLMAGASTWACAAHAQPPARRKRVTVLLLYAEDDPEGQLRANAFRAESPMLLIGGNSALKQYRMGGLQELRHTEMMTPISKFASLVMTTRTSIKLILAWSTVAQMGFMLVQCGLGVSTPRMAQRAIW